MNRNVLAPGRRAGPRIGDDAGVVRGADEADGCADAPGDREGPDVSAMRVFGFGFEMWIAIFAT